MVTGNEPPIRAARFRLRASAPIYAILPGMAEKTAVYPGTFDPMTRGHFDLITRAAGLYDRLIVAVAATSAKTGALYDAAHRLAMIREDVEGAGLGNVTVEVLDTLLVDFCRRHGARVVIRGVRVYSDF